ncbi:hypothetical protein JKP88DRAFT_294230 [Tribonema minus]|uniref:Uncharacterized protein n=1 Tax=Tribonema minus TaxID=303371 RepID=A0A835ZP11_9STRA|nr:hypothetical protein JKP88DRAFT_294230 [Tribonema minus]
MMIPLAIAKGAASALLAGIALHGATTMPASYPSTLLIADTADTTPAVIKGVVSLDTGAVAPPQAGSALFVTARLRAPQASAVVAAAKYAEPALPFEFEIAAGDLTPDGQEFVKSATAPLADLTISARLDSDGDANTRSPDDLVGRSTVRGFAPGRTTSAAATEANVKLVGRGIGGKFITARQ